MSRTFTLAVERIADDRRFAERFRRDPDRALKPYRLDRAQVEAIKSGQPDALAAQGLDVEAFDDGKRHGLRPHLRKVAIGASVLGATFGMLVMPRTASADFEVCKIGTCPTPTPEPVITGLRTAEGRASIRIGRVLLGRASVRHALRRAGRMDAGRALGRVALRRQLSELCLEGCEVKTADGGPILISTGD